MLLSQIWRVTNLLTISTRSTSVGDLQALIQRAVNSHNTKYYSDVLAVSIYFSDDDTMAKGDADTFANFAARIGVKHEHLLLSDRHPEFQLLGYLYTSLVKFAIAGKCLLFLHYAGHGTPEEGQYHWYANSGKNSRKVRWSIIRDRLLLSEVASDNEIFGNLDVVCIIDSCHSGLATRGNPMTTRSINIMAACNGAGMARSRQGGITFTQRFVTSCLFQLKSCGTGMLDIAAIGIALSGDSAATKAVWEVLLGTPITLQVGGGQFAAVGSGGPDTMPVILSVHVDTNVEGVAIFINWLKTLKKDFKAFDIEVEFGYPSSSYILGLVCSPVLGHYLELLPGALTLGHKAGKIQVFEKATIRSKCPPLGDRTNSKRSANILEQ